MVPDPFPHNFKRMGATSGDTHNTINFDVSLGPRLRVPSSDPSGPEIDRLNLNLSKRFSKIHDAVRQVAVLARAREVMIFN